MTTPTPNAPLTAEDVTLLKAGDVLRHETYGLTKVRAIYDGGTVAYRNLTDPHRGGGDDFSRFTFIGRPDPEGWIPAPEGGWAVNPVPGQIVDVRFKDGDTVTGLSDDHTAKRWSHDLTIFLRFHIIAFRLASLSPAASAIPQFLATEDGEFNGPSTDPAASEDVAEPDLSPKPNDWPWRTAAKVLGWTWSPAHDGYISEAHRNYMGRSGWDGYFVAVDCEEACDQDGIDTLGSAITLLGVAL